MLSSANIQTNNSIRTNSLNPIVYGNWNDKINESRRMISMNHPRDVSFPSNSSTSNRHSLVTKNSPSSVHNQNQNQNQSNEAVCNNNEINDYIINRNHLSPKYPSSSIQPSLSTVVIGKGKIPKNAPGNIHFRNLVRDRLQEYVDAKSKAVKSSIVTNVFSSIQETCFREQGAVEGVFLRYDHGFYSIASESAAREKISATFRDCLSEKYKSSSKNKVAKRRLANKERTTAAAAAVAEGKTKHKKQQQLQKQGSSLSCGSMMMTTTATSNPSSFIKSTTQTDYKDNKTYSAERVNPTVFSSRNPQHPVSNLMRRSSSDISSDEPIPISAFSNNNQGPVGRNERQL
ncbi:hypothetical protein FRACYDRAFT_254208 [Fragilariopsis cylindrus CCMP1102]|uniref:DUF6824 domain-containing protein n=1 Tax=Fragilariopsis cylindrus CCMP1102 TaxID=635003 RepID=A0A1E7ELA0_9STRA|nr:hypothetical protein FRACYDRAFT_254208 [Fragilariopsis cylindrus CCMP1102]|eukprot:OEU06654.1 hypothetical protein FRACYDRAFT_254208 [Fragilariopsis cylindrus CCMP1102]